MSAIYFAIPTDAGQAKIANALALGVPLKITHMAVGDGNGQPVTPNAAQTALVREKRRAPINTLFQDPTNQSQLVAEQIIPEDVGDWWIREAGIFSEDGTLIAIANTPDTYKPLLSSGAGRTQVIRIVIIVSDTSAVDLKIDPAVVLATRKYVDDVALSSYPVGAPIPWPMAVPPTGFIAMKGQSFSALTYPKLAQAYPSLVLPDMRAEFIRGWDNGRGADIGRNLLTAQACQVEAHKHRLIVAVNRNEARDVLGTLTGDPIAVKATDPSSIVEYSSERIELTGGTETRPKNIAFNYIVRAA
ncbi:phage tail protein [Aeromonas media]|uniref:Phage tail protein n=1 Tax=Aeromonas media TaxID=651 RepID=A0AAP6GAC7_AERME|nr:phage tail protein [Aeromonas media]MDX7921616.1 phage tail protein [Aeromonas media]